MKLTLQEACKVTNEDDAVVPTALFSFLNHMLQPFTGGIPKAIPLCVLKQGRISWGATVNAFGMPPLVAQISQRPNRYLETKLSYGIQY